MCLHLRLTPARAAFARPGPHATAFPDVNAPMQPSDSLVPFGRRSGRPSPAAYPGAEVLFFTAAPLPRETGTTPETFLPRLPSRRLPPEEGQGPPRCLGHPLSRVPQSSTPPGAMRPSPCHGALAVAFRSSETLGTRNAFDFGALLPTAHSLACLRFAQAVTVSGARLATGRAGSPLAGRGSHPLDDEQGFMVSSHTPILLDQPCLVAPKAGIHTAYPNTNARSGDAALPPKPLSKCLCFHHGDKPLRWLLAPSGVLHRRSLRRSLSQDQTAGKASRLSG